VIKLKDILSEDFGGSYGGNKNRSYKNNTYYSRGEWFDRRDDKTSRPTLPTPKEWDDLMDRVNNDPRFETYTGKDGYQIKDTRGPSSNLKWQLTPGRFGWSGIGRDSAEYPHPRQFNDVKELIKNFYEVTGLSPDSAVIESVITEEEYKVAGRPVTLIKNGTEDQTKWEVKFQNGTVKQYVDVISLIKPRPELQEPRWQDNDGDGKWYEKGDDVKESALAENMRRFGTKNIQG